MDTMMFAFLLQLKQKQRHNPLLLCRNTQSVCKAATVQSYITVRGSHSNIKTLSDVTYKQFVFTTMTLLNVTVKLEYH